MPDGIHCEVIEYNTYAEQLQTVAGAWLQQARRNSFLLIFTDAKNVIIILYKRDLKMWQTLDFYSNN